MEKMRIVGHIDPWFQFQRLPKASWLSKKNTTP